MPVSWVRGEVLYMCTGHITSRPPRFSAPLWRAGNLAEFKWCNVSAHTTPEDKLIRIGLHMSVDTFVVGGLWIMSLEINIRNISGKNPWHLQFVVKRKFWPRVSVTCYIMEHYCSKISPGHWPGTVSDNYGFLRRSQNLTNSTSLFDIYLVKLYTLV